MDAPVTFAWSSDTFGQGVVPLYPILAAVDDLDRTSSVGVVRVDPAGPTLTLEVRDEPGTVRFATDIEATE